MTDTEAPEIGADDDLKRKLRNWDRELDRHWSKWQREAKECWDIYSGRSWTKEERNALEEMQRVPVEFNRTAPLLKAVVGAEITGRLRVDYKPRTVGDSQTNELLTSAAEWCRDESDAEGEESDAFLSSLVCGMGWTESRLDFEEEPDGKYTKTYVKAIEMAVDPSAQRSCALDKRYLRRRRDMAKDVAKERFGDQLFAGDDDETVGYSVDDPENAYERDDEKRSDDSVTITEYQWFDLEPEHLVMNPRTGEAITVTADQLKALKRSAEAVGLPIEYSTRRKRVYKRVFMSGQQFLTKVEEIPTGCFTYNCITGDYDENEGVWHGLVRAMKDPQKWANKFFSQILHIISSNSKGGLMIEESAIPDLRELEESWAASDAVTVLADGAIQSGRIKEKPMTTYPSGIDRMMDSSLTAIRETAGVSPEMMGMVAHNQPGVLEHQRKQASYGILAKFFDSLRRYRRDDGKLLIELMKLLPSSTLVRVSLDEWQNPQYVRIMDLALQNTRFDTEVSEAPNGPNQKERTFAAMMQLLPAIKELLTPDLIVEMLEFSPFPAAFIQKMKAKLEEAGQNPEAQKAKVIEMADAMANLQGKQALTAKTQAEARQKQVETELTMMRPDPRPQVVM